MDSFIIKNGTLIDKYNNLLYCEKDIRVKKGIIEEIGENLNTDGYEIVDAKGKYVSAGMIDVHVHEQLRANGESFGDPDMLGVRRGVTTMIECGSVALNGIDEFAEISNACNTKYLALLSGHSPKGWAKVPLEIDALKTEEYYAAIQKYPELFKGLKCACSNSITGYQGYALVNRVKQIARDLQVPLTVHVGTYPPDPNGLIEFLEEGDVVTHTYHGKEVSLFEEDGEAKYGFKKARERGVYFDVGHGSHSYSCIVFDKAARKGFLPDIISTDIRKINVDGPAYSLAAVMSKCLAYMPLEDVIHCNTYTSAKAYSLGNIGQIRKGYIGDFTIFTMQDGEFTLKDCYGNDQLVKQMIVPEKVIVSGGEKSAVYGCDQGYRHN